MAFKIDKVYVINLTRANDQIIKKLNTLPIKQTEFFILDACNGWDVVAGKEQPRFNYKVADWWKIDHELNFYSRDVTPGEIGCGLSHYECVKLAYDEGKETILILEEDFVFNGEWPSDDTLNKIPNDWSMFNFGRCGIWSEDEEEILGDDLIRVGYSHRNQAYCVSRKGMKEILNSDYLNNVIVNDEFYPALHGTHDRQDAIDKFYNKDFRYYATRKEYFNQESNPNRDSLTEFTPEYVKALRASAPTTDYNSFVNTIPSRLKESNCLRNTVDSILTQTLPPQKVYVCIPQHYKRFDITVDESFFPEWMKENPRIEIISGHDYGPATMYVYSYKIGGNMCAINDDSIYDPSSLERLSNFKRQNNLDVAGGWSFLWWYDKSRVRLDPKGAKPYSPYDNIDYDITYLQSVDMILSDSSFYEGFGSFLDICHYECPKSFLNDDITHSYYLQYNKKKIDSLYKGEDGVGTYKEQETAYLDSLSLDDTKTKLFRMEKYNANYEIIDYLKERFPIA